MARTSKSKWDRYGSRGDRILPQRVYTPLRESVQAITQKHALDAGWFNYLAQEKADYEL